MGGIVPTNDLPDSISGGGLVPSTDLPQQPLPYDEQYRRQLAQMSQSGRADEAFAANMMKAGLGVREALQGFPGAADFEKQLGNVIGVENLSKLKSFIPAENQNREQILKRAALSAEASPAGALIADVAKYAPAALTSPALVPQMLATGTLGALYEPNDRLSAGITEGALAGIGGALIKGATKIPGLFSGGLDQARRALRELIGGEQNATGVLQALNTARPGATTAQVLTEVGVITPTRNQTLAAGLDEFGRQLETVPNPVEAANFWQGVAPRQEAAQLAELERLAGGSSAEQTAKLRSQMLSDLENKLRPLRETQLGLANVGKEAIEPMLQRAAQLEQEALTYGGISAEAGKLRDMVAFLQRDGFQPLDTRPIIGRVQSVLDDPKLGASVNVSDVMSRVGGLVNEWVKRGGGTIDANALYQIRKSGVNEAIDRLLAGADPVVSKKLAAKLSSEIRPLIDDAIEQAGAPGWRQYISQYGEGLEKIDRQELLDTVRQLFKSEGGKQAFMDLVKGESPEVVQKIMSGKRGIADALPPETLARLEDITTQLQRDQILKEVVTPDTRAAAQRVLNDASFVGKLPNLLNRWMVLGNVAIKKGEMVMNRKMYALLDQAARDPKAMQELISKLPTKQQDEMIREISKIGSIGGAVYADQQQ